MKRNEADIQKMFEESDTTVPFNNIEERAARSKRKAITQTVLSLLLWLVQIAFYVAVIWLVAIHI